MSTYEKGVFQLTAVNAKLDHVSLHEQKHGKKKVTGVSLKISTNLSNRALDMFAPGLYKSFFQEEDEPNGTVFESPDDASLTKLVHGSLIKEIAFNRELVGANVSIAYGQSDDGALVFDEAKVDSIKAELHEGGSITLNFKVKTLPGPGDLDKITMLLGSEITISVTPPSNPQGSIPFDGDDEGEDDE